MKKRRIDVRIVIRKFLFAYFVFIAICAVAASASAKDAVVAAIGSPMTPSNPIIIQNGTQYSQGTYAVGTIQLFYTVPAYQFPAGNFGYFTLDLSIQSGKNTPTTNYPVVLSLKQTGSANLDLDPVTDSFNVDSASWHGNGCAQLDLCRQHL